MLQWRIRVSLVVNFSLTFRHLVSLDQIDPIRCIIRAKVAYYFIITRGILFSHHVVYFFIDIRINYVKREKIAFL